MQRLLFIAFFLFYPLSSLASVDNVQPMLTVFGDKKLKTEFSGFLEEVLRQVPTQSFYTMIEDFNGETSAKTDIELYQKVQTHMQKIHIKSSPVMYYQLKALAHQKTVLTDQFKKLLTHTKAIDGCVEIGTPGTYTSCVKSFLPVTGKSYVINDQERLGDFVQSFSWNPTKKFLAYDHFVSLNDYAPIANTIPDQSVDLVICVIGLHHIPQEKIIPFVQSIARILRPGGTFILRDHDCTTQTLNAIVHTAHSVFNLIVTNETVEAERNEYRNFQPLSHWIMLVEKEGFSVGSDRLLQAGDPTLNTMLSFTKVAKTQEEKVSALSHSLKKQPYYIKDLLDSYLTAPEWANVDAAQEYGSFINHTPFYEFPYLKTVGTYWKVFAKSWRAAAGKKGHWAVIKSPATLMNVFIGTTMTAEYLAKSLISLPIRLAYQGSAPTAIQALIKDSSNTINTIDSRIKVLESYDYNLKLISLPRYKQFLEIITKLPKNITLVEIGGQKEIQVKVRCLKTQQNVLTQLGLCNQEYTWLIPTQPDYIYAVLNVPVVNLLETVELFKQKGIQLLYIHDF
jgi:SAM-dependent methyltransferase